MGRHFKPPLCLWYVNKACFDAVGSRRIIWRPRPMPSPSVCPQWVCVCACVCAFLEPWVALQNLPAQTPRYRRVVVWPGKRKAQFTPFFWEEVRLSFVLVGGTMISCFVVAAGSQFVRLTRGKDATRVCGSVGRWFMSDIDEPLPR